MGRRYIFELSHLLDLINIKGLVDCFALYHIRFRASLAKTVS